MYLRVLNATDREKVLKEGQPAFRSLEKGDETKLPAPLSSHFEEWSKELETNQKEQLKKLLINNKDIFSRHNYDSTYST